jgi:hypothetical protein
MDEDEMMKQIKGSEHAEIVHLRESAHTADDGPEKPSAEQQLQQQHTRKRRRSRLFYFLALFAKDFHK